jgi:hypothetical protein
LDGSRFVSSIYEFFVPRSSLRMSPAMAAGVSKTLNDMDWIVGLIGAREEAPKPRGPYKKRGE